MPIRAVLFDIGGVLLTLGEAEYRRSVAALLGWEEVPATYDDWLPAIQRGEATEADVWATLAGRPVDVRAFDAPWLAGYRLIPGMLALAQELRSAGLRVAILSNTEAEHVRLMRDQMDFLPTFHDVFMSCDIGSRKPERAAFLHVLSRLGLPPEEVAYIDDVPAYVAAAAELGIRAILHQDEAATRRALAAMLRT